MSMTTPAAWRLPDHDDPPLPSAWRLHRTQLAAARELVTTIRERDRDGHESEWRSNGEVENLTPMLQATRPFTAVYDGERVQITADTWVCRDHAIARSNPSMFRAVASRSASARSTTSADTLIRHADAIEVKLRALRRLTPRKRAKPKSGTPARSAAKRGWRLPELRPPAVIAARDRSDVELRTTRSSTSLVVPARVRQVIADEAACKRQLETGGLLVGEAIWSWHRQISIASAHGPAATSEHGETWLRLGEVPALVLEDELERYESSLVEVGSWHTHPVTGSGTPSPADLNSWAAWLGIVEKRVGGSKRYVGMIVTPTRGVDGGATWARHEIHAYLLHRDRSRVICEPCEVILR